MVERALSKHDELKECVLSGKGKKKRTPGGGRKPIQPEVGTAMFRWFVDVRVGLKGRLSTKLFKAKCKELHEAALARKRQDGIEVTEAEQNMKFTRRWVSRYYYYSLFKNVI